MSKEEEFLAIGKLVAEYQAVKQRMSVRDYRLGELGRDLQKLAGLLQAAPSTITFGPGGFSPDLLSTEVMRLVEESRADDKLYVELHGRIRSLGLIP